MFTDAISEMRSTLNKALTAYNSSNTDESYRLCMELLNKIPVQFLNYISDTLHIIGLIQISHGEHGEGRKNLEKANILFPNNSQVHAHIGLHYAETENNIEKAAIELKKAEAINPDDPIVKTLKQYIEKNKADQLPSIFLNSMPKSASISVWKALYGGLCVPRHRLSLNIKSLKYETVDPERAKTFAQGNCVALEHLAATNNNLFALESAGIDRLILHVRDPRQAMLSWVHFIDKLNQSNDFNVVDYPLCDGYFSLSHEDQIHCKDYFESSFEEKIDTHIKHYLPLLVEWVSGWIEVDENPNRKMKILFTEFEDFKHEPLTYFEKILSFYTIDKNKFNISDSGLNKGKGHFRKGLVDEFRDVFSEKQLTQANELIPDKIFNKFGWRK